MKARYQRARHERPVLLASRRTKTMRAVLRPLRASSGWWGRHRYPLLLVAMCLFGVATAAVAAGGAAGLGAAAVACGFMAYMTDPGSDQP